MLWSGERENGKMNPFSGTQDYGCSLDNEGLDGMKGVEKKIDRACPNCFEPLASLNELARNLKHAADGLKESAYDDTTLEQCRWYREASEAVRYASERVTLLSKALGFSYVAEEKSRRETAKVAKRRRRVVKVGGGG